MDSFVGASFRRMSRQKRHDCRRPHELPRQLHVRLCAQVLVRRMTEELVVDLRARAAISDVASAFPKFAILGTTRTSFQRIAEGTPISKAVASFQRHVKGMATTAPAAARKCATGSPSMPATRPHTALPTVIAPKKTIKNIASPLARTQSGKATWAAA